MAATHDCPLCAYSRAAEHAAILDPACPRCGGMLGSAALASGPGPEGLPAFSGRRWFERSLVALILAPLLAAAAKAGWDAAGAAAGAGALAFAVLLAYVAVAPAGRPR